MWRAPAARLPLMEGRATWHEGTSVETEQERYPYGGTSEHCTISQR